MEEERLQKILARTGLGSRRAVEELITAGRVRVNGRVASLGEKANPDSDKITVDGRPIKLAEELVYIAVHKPRGVLSTVMAEDPRPTVRSLISIPGRLYPVGRLDADSEGLILLTNDGELANRLTHPRYGHEKEYKVLVARRPDEEQLETWRRGVVLEDGYRTAPAEVRVEAPFGKGAWLRVTMREGRKRQIRETGSLLGLPVVRIVRVRIGTLQLGGLKPREWRHLASSEVAALKGKGVAGQQPAIPPKKRAPKPSVKPAGSKPMSGRSSRRPGYRRSDDRSPSQKPADSPRTGSPFKKKPRSRG